jgi:serine/threonine protein kinase/tetratricopeptide (TPR) repeat protein
MTVQSQLLETVLGERYKIDRELGRGGMAVVYLARDLRQDREVAVKVLHPDLSMALGPERFRREIQVSTALSHPHILPVYDSGEVGGSLYYVMPYVAGESLAAKLHREKQLSIEDAVRITAEVAYALDYAHKRGFVHRDIKPENILLGTDGQAIVADFGIARAISATGDEKLTQTGVTLGTPAYMSPEQAMAEREIDGRSDLYSLGCVLYELLAGQTPFFGPTAQAIIARQMVGAVPSLTVVRGTIPEALEEVVLAALSKVPADRFKTAGEFGDALKEAMGALPTTRRATISRRVARSGKKRRFPVWAIALTVFLIAAGAAAVFAYREQHPAVARGGANSDMPPQRIAVLYFDDLSNDHSLAPLATGLTEDVIGALSSVQTLDVISKNGVAQFRDAQLTSDSIAHTLHAGTLVKGSVEQAGNRVHVSVRLIDGVSGADYKRASFDAPAKNPLATRDTLVRQVAALIRARLGDEVRLREQRQGTTNPDAWALVQRAEQRRREGEKRFDAADTAGLLREFGAADSLLAAAGALDANYIAVPITRGAMDYRASRFFGNDPTRASSWIDKGLVHARAALAIDPQSPDALELLGTIRYWRWLLALEPEAGAAKRLLDSARANLEGATKINPSQAGAWAVLSHLYYQVNDVVEAKLAARRAYETDAYLSNADVILWRLFTSSYDLEQFPEAAHWCQQGVQRFATEARFTECRLHLMGVPGVTPDVSQAWLLADSLVALTPEPQRPYTKLDAEIMVAGAIGRAGMLDSARHVLERGADPPDLDPTKDLTLARGAVWNALNDKDHAIKALQTYIAANPARAADLGSDNNWMWRSLKEDPRFQALIQKSRK